MKKRIDNTPRGERQPSAKLTDEAAREIVASQETGVELAKRFGVSTVLVHYVRSGKAWSHATGLPPVKRFESIRELRAEGLL